MVRGFASLALRLWLSLFFVHDAASKSLKLRHNIGKQLGRPYQPHNFSASLHGEDNHNLRSSSSNLMGTKHHLHNFSASFHGEERTRRLLIPMVNLLNNNASSSARLSSVLTDKQLGTSFPTQQNVLHMQNVGTEEVRHAPGKLFLLFLTLNGVERPELWQAFLNFNEANYHAFVHCKFNCEGVPTHWKIVPSVYTAYCSDLVTAMVQLLHYALQSSFSSSDKFVFLSESTLPVKPFSEVYATLMQNQNSDFCVAPSGAWVRLRGNDGSQAFLIKHSQWVVLNREHAQTVNDTWPTINPGAGGSKWSVPIWSNAGIDESVQTSLPKSSALRVCTDEWAMFASIYGIIVAGQAVQDQELPGFGAPLELYGRNPQSVCRTFAFWGLGVEVAWVDWPPSSTALAREIYQDGPHSRISCYPDPCYESSHPASFLALSDRGVALLRRSSFLFARKFPQHVMSKDQFQRIVLAVEPH